MSVYYGLNHDLLEQWRESVPWSFRVQSRGVAADQQKRLELTDGGQTLVPESTQILRRVENILCVQ